MQECNGITYGLGYEHGDKIGTRWFWSPNEKARPVDELLGIYRKVLAEAGNLLLNVPFDRSGRVPGESVEALMNLKDQIGEDRQAGFALGKGVR